MMNPSHIEPQTQAALSAHDAVENGIAAAKSGNRLLARWQLESVAGGKDVRPDVWLWLAWVAESPVKAQEYLSRLVDHPVYGGVATGGLSWLEVLNGGPVPTASSAASRSKSSATMSRGAVGGSPKSEGGPQSDESVIQCPGCEATLYVKSSAMGRPRRCPACDGQFLVELDHVGKIQARSIAASATGRASSEEEFASPVATPTHPVTTTGDTILVVDDSPTIRRVASMILNKHGYKVLTANTGEEGLAIAQSDMPQLILLDINMPGFGGYETCKRLRANKETRHIPVVMLSGNDGLFDQVKGYQAGSSKYLTKPCDARAMLTTVRQLLSRPVAMKS